MSLAEQAPAVGIDDMDIAIIGMAGRFPGAADVDAFWRNLRDGVESVTRFSDEELRERGVPEALLNDPAYVKAGVLLEQLDCFDAAYFGYTPRQAQYLDPQQRIFLETAVQALEHAGRFGPSRPARTGVYAGGSANQYIWRNLMPAGALQGVDGVPSQLLLLGNDKDALAMRVAYELDLRGPAITVQTACSTSLVATHLACQALLNHEVDMALAGGVSLKLDQHLGYPYETGSIRSPDGHCRAFDAAAAGTISGSGAGIVVLRRLADAIAGGDTVLAVIKGSAINNDGAGRVGYTAPGVDGQAQVIAAAQAIAAVTPDSIGYVEAHGTGTVMGDPIEVAALTQAFRAGTARRAYCALGSVKTNIGHLDAAAGVAGVIKTVQALRHRSLPASLHFQQPNPSIDFDASPFFVNAATRPWQAGAQPRRAGVSSFGMGGTNAHVVLQEAPPAPPTAADARWQLLPLSAKSASALQAACLDLATHLEDHPEINLADLAWTLQDGRRAHPLRRSLAVRDAASAASLLRQLATQDAPLPTPQAPPVAFLFPGQGAQHAGMGHSLYREEPLFARIVDQCCAKLAPWLGCDLRSVMFEAAGAERLTQTALAQPALFVIEYALARCWIAWGVQPRMMLGHSVGEYVAACLAGVFSLDDGLRLIATRAQLMQRLPPGAMLAVAATAPELAPWLASGCSLAAINDEHLCVLSGSAEAIAAAATDLQARGVVTRALHVSHAFHSALVDPILDEFEAAVATVRLSPPAMAFMSNVSGAPITDAQACSPAYWRAHLRGTVRFADGLRGLLQGDGHVLLEVGPGEVLSGLARRHAPDLTIASQAHARDVAGAAGAERMAQALGRLWQAGVDIDWAARHHAPRRRLPLPAYRFDAVSHWITPPASSRVSAAATAPATGIPPLEHWFLAPQWRRAEPCERKPLSGPVVLLDDDSPLGLQLAAQLRAEGLAVQVLGSGVELAAADLGGVRHIFHLFSTGPAADLARGYHSLAALARALPPDSSGVRITVVTSGLADITGGEALHPLNATLHGLCEAIPREYAGVSVRLVDVQAGPDPRLAQQLRDESMADGNGELVAWRGPHRWRCHHEHVRREAGLQQRLRQGGVYLISGGLGGMGLAMARHLAQKWQARLVLLGRSAPSATIEVPPQDLLVLQADLADATAVRAALARAQQQFGRIDGVIHAAGVAGGGIIAGGTPAASEAVFAPKLAGTDALLAALQGQAPDFILLCSAMSAVVGQAGGADYCAANAYLDAVAVREQRAGRAVFSVNWDTWLEVGMAARRGHPAGARGLTAAQGMEVLERILAGPATAQTLVSLWELGERRVHAGAPDYAALPEAAAPARAAHRRPALATPFAAPEAPLHIELARLWGEALGFTELGIHDSLFELGGDSLTAIGLLGRIQKQYGVTLYPADLFNAPTIAALADMIELRLIEQIAEGQAS